MTPARDGRHLGIGGGRPGHPAAGQPGLDQGYGEGPLHLAGRPVTGISRPSVDVAPTSSPTEPSQARTAARVAGVGPKAAANWPVAR